MIKLLTIYIFILSLITNAAADTSGGRITGIIRDIETKKPVPGATVLLANRYAGDSSDEQGRFVIDKLSYGVYALKISRLGYEPSIVENIKVDSVSKTEYMVELIPKVLKLNSVTVTPGRFNIMGEEAATQQTLTQREMRTMPQLGDDFFRAVTRLPGMSSNDFSTRFSVRGGEYDEVLIMLDGLRIYEPFHLKDIDGGAMSIIDVEAVESIDLMTGGFPAVYGDKNSAAFGIKSRRVPLEKTRMSMGLSFINARFFGEGRFDDNRGSWLFSTRRGYIDYVLKLTGADDNIKPTYYDIFGKVQYQLNERNSLAVHLLHASDDLKFLEDEEGVDTGDTLLTEYGNSYVWATLWSQISSKIFAQTVISAGEVSHDRFGVDIGDAGIITYGHDYENSNFAGFKTDWEYEYSDNLVLKSGIDIKALSTDYDYQSRDYFYNWIIYPDSIHYELDHIDTLATPLDKSGIAFGTYLSNRFRLTKKLVMEAGIRYDYIEYTGDKDVSPRLNMAYNIGENTTLRAGWGLYYQSEQINEISVGDRETEFFKSQKAENIVAGLEHEFANGIHLRLEAYNKKYSDLRPKYRNTIDILEAFPERENDRVFVYFKKARSRGVELYLKKDNGGKISWWASYAYAKADEILDHIYFPREDVSAFFNLTVPKPHDQRHTLYLDCHYRPSSRWLLSAALQIHSGWPYTDAYLVTNPTPDGVQYWAQMEQPWSSTFEAFHRLDLRFNRYFPLSKGRITAFIELLNVYGKKNIRRYSFNIRGDENGVYLYREPEYWFGRLPSFGVSYDFEF